MRALVSRSLAHPTLPDAEFAAVMAAEGIPATPAEERGRLRVWSLDAPVEDCRRAFARLAMTHEVTDLWVHTDAGVSHLSAAARAHPLPDAAPFAVRATRTAPDAPRGPLSRKEVEQALGAAWGETAPVSLAAPERVVRVWLEDDDAMIGEQVFAHDPKGFDARASKNRPFFSPVSGDPRWMRAIVNLANVTRGDTLYDPLCGTGGVVLEAGLIGIDTIASDLDPEMVEGARANCAHFDAPIGHTFTADVREAPARLAEATGRHHVDAIVTDLPYGQSATTATAAPKDVAQWTLEATSRILRPGGRAVIGAADPDWLAHPPAELVAGPAYALRVHRSLTRTYQVFERPA